LREIDLKYSVAFKISHNASIEIKVKIRTPAIS